MPELHYNKKNKKKHGSLHIDGIKGFRDKYPAPLSPKQVAPSGINCQMLDGWLLVLNSFLHKKSRILV